MTRPFINTIFTILLFSFGCNTPVENSTSLDTGVEQLQAGEIDFQSKKIIAAADQYLSKSPVTITDFPSPRSAGGIHDYYSEGAYWWENSEDPNGPYIRKDGRRNPNNFDHHKNALRELSTIVTTLTAAYQLTNDPKYAHQAVEHIRAWFVNEKTRMNPNLLYAQAIKGINTGRGIGIIDTLRLINVALSIEFLEQQNILVNQDLAGTKKWFNDFSEWLTTHPYGHDERDNNNNHSTWWGAQVAAFARVADREDILKISQEQFKKQLTIQMEKDGSFPHELERTKPFHYTNYTLRGWTSYAHLASTPSENLWAYNSKNGTLQKAVEFAIPFYKNPEKWPYLTDLEKEIHLHRNDFLILAHWGLDKMEYVNMWNSLDENLKDNDEGDANLIIWENEFSK